MCGGMLQGIFMFSPVDSNRGNDSQLVQMSSLINRTAEVECHLLQQLSVGEYGCMCSALYRTYISITARSPHLIIFVSAERNTEGQYFFSILSSSLFSLEVFVDVHTSELPLPVNSKK